MVIAVTGASGFIGSHLTDELERRGHRVVRLSRTTVDYRNVGALANALSETDVVIHAAGATRSPSPASLFDANVTVTSNVLAAFHGAGRRFVFVSSQAAAGPARALDAPTSEDDPPAPMEAYGRSKLDAEQLVATSALPWSIVRPCSVYGPRDRDFLQLFRLASRGVAVHPANRESWVSIAHVRDVVDGIIAAATMPVAVGRRYFLANAEPAQWQSLFERAAASAGRQLKLDVEVPRLLVDIGARLGDIHARLTGDASLLTTEKVALSRAPFWICSNERARRELGFAPRVSLDEGFSETWKWYVEHQWA